MWFLLHCGNNNEKRTLDLCKKAVSQGYIQNAFCLTYDQMRKYQGEWHLEKKNLFPEYIILENDSNDSQKQLLESIEKLYETSHWKAGKTKLIPVGEKEKQFLQGLYGETQHLLMSKGIIRGKETHVMEGPLRGHEQNIRKIDRHKRLAFLNMYGWNVGVDVKVGLEITEKSL